MKKTLPTVPGRDAEDLASRAEWASSMAEDQNSHLRAAYAHHGATLAYRNSLGDEALYHNYKAGEHFAKAKELGLNTYQLDDNPLSFSGGDFEDLLRKDAYDRLVREAQRLGTAEAWYRVREYLNGEWDRLHDQYKAETKQRNSNVSKLQQDIINAMRSGGRGEAARLQRVLDSINAQAMVSLIEEDQQMKVLERAIEVAYLGVKQAHEARRDLPHLSRHAEELTLSEVSSELSPFAKVDPFVRKQSLEAHVRAAAAARRQGDDELTDLHIRRLGDASVDDPFWVSDAAWRIDSSQSHAWAMRAINDKKAEVDTESDGGQETYDKLALLEKAHDDRFAVLANELNDQKEALEDHQKRFGEIPLSAEEKRRLLRGELDLGSINTVAAAPARNTPAAIFVATLGIAAAVALWPPSHPSTPTA